MEAEIRIDYKTEKEAEAVVKAVSPDNVKVPRGLNVKTIRHGKSTITKISCERKLETFIATIDDLLQASQVAENAVSAKRA